MAKTKRSPVSEEHKLCEKSLKPRTVQSKLLCRGSGLLPHDLRDTLEHVPPIASIGLAKQSHGRIPGAVVSTEKETPVGNLAQRHKNLPSQRACKMRDRGIRRDDQIQMHHNRGRIQKCGRRRGHWLTAIATVMVSADAPPNVSGAYALIETAERVARMRPGIACRGHRAGLAHPDKARVVPLQRLHDAGKSVGNSSKYSRGLMESAAAWGDSGLPVRPLFQVHAPYAQTTQGNDLAGSLLTAPSFLRGPHAVRCGCLCAHAGNGEKNGGECARDQDAIVHHILTGTCFLDDARN
jgi:hypothetical protein